MSTRMPVHIASSHTYVHLSEYADTHARSLSAISAANSAAELLWFELKTKCRDANKENRNAAKTEMPRMRTNEK